MPNKNYISGRNFESRFIANLLEKGNAVKGGRFHASKGITDVWWVDKKGIHHEAQLKFSSIRRPVIGDLELNELTKFAHEMRDYMKIWLVKKEARKPVEMELLN